MSVKSIVSSLLQRAGMKNKYDFLLILTFLRLILPFLLQHEVYEPHRDEFLYLAEGNHLAWGFMEVPPMLSVFAWITQLVNGGIFWIKLWPFLFGIATFYVMGRLVILLGGHRFALLMLFLSFMFTGYLRIFYLFMPNAPEVFFWSMVAYSLVRYVQSGHNKWLYVFGVCAALGMLSKYTMLFYLAGLLLALLLTPYRTVFTNKHFWFGCGLGFVIFLPNLLWQMNHHFPVVYHMKLLHQTQLQYVSRADFIKDQVVMFLPCLFVWISGLYNLFYSRDKRFRFVGLSYIFTIALLAAGSAKGYYTLGLYPVLFAFGSYNLEKFTYTMKGLRYLFAGVSLILGIILMPVILPVFNPVRLARFYQKGGLSHLGLLHWEDQKDHPLPQDFSDMLGWEEMAKKVGDAYHSLPEEEQKQTVIFANNYGMAGAINYYRKKYKLPEAYSDNASFLYWLPDSVSFRNLVLVTSNQNELAQDYIKYFTSARITDSVTTPFAREHGDLIMLGTGADERFQKFYTQKILQDKKDLMPY